jgi:hypothetical protein
VKRKAGLEANIALFNAYEDYKKLSAEAIKFEMAKLHNNDRLPLSMWREWREWKKRLRAADERLEKFYK